MRTTTLFLVVLTLAFVPVQAQSSGDIVISEIMYAPDGTDSDREYIEVYNTTAGSINLNGWTIVGEDPSSSSPTSDEITSDVVVESGGFALLCENNNTADNGDVNCDFDYLNDLDHTNTSDYVILKEGGVEIDRVRYDESSGWPNATSASLEFTEGVGTDNNVASSWQEATQRAGDFADTSGPNNGSPNVNTPGGALPVELASFDVTVDGRRAVLRWTTTSETNNAGFAVQHRPATASTFQTVGERDGAGTTTQPQSYRFETSGLAGGTHTFRLKQTDLDGTTHVSEPRTVEVSTTDGLTVAGPNPIQHGEQATVIVEGTSSEPVSVTLYDILGQRVRTLVSSSRSQGVVRVDLSTADLASGTYLIRASGPSLTATERITVVR